MSSVYNFKSVTVVPSGKEFLDIVLSKTQRKTPTVVHKGYHISRIRQFYMRKVKFTQKTINEKLSHIISDFPRLDDVHPFYSDLMHVLYDRDHYKVALGQVGAVRHMVDSIGRDYVRLIKYGDSLYRCKQLKRAALGRMATACKKLSKALSYLEKVRQHLARLPAIDPSAPTLLVTGFPNVGKSSFMNKVTRADVEVQPYAFTTKSLFVGHTDYNYEPWQVIDTPGILDHSLEQRNIIEMQAITALAHLRACVLFFMDLSGQCGFSIHQQLSLMRSIRPLFVNKPLIVVLNKCDVCKLDDLAEPERETVLECIKDLGAQVLTTSTLTDVGVGDLKRMGCNMVLEHRVEEKEKSGRYQAIQNRLYLSQPKTRDRVQRGAFVPQSVIDEEDTPEDEKTRRKTQRDYEWENGGPGQYQANERITWDLENPEWNDDIMPDFMDGHNIYDSVDPDIAERLQALEDEEDERIAQQELDQSRAPPTFAMDDDTIGAVKLIRDRIKVMKMQKALKNPLVRRTHEQNDAIERFNSRTGSQVPVESRAKRSRSDSAASEAMMRDRSGSHVSTRQSRDFSNRSTSGDRASTVGRGEGYRDINDKLRAVKMDKKARHERTRDGRKGDADRRVPVKMPKHLFTGKVKTNGKRDRR